MAGAAWGAWACYGLLTQATVALLPLVLVFMLFFTLIAVAGVLLLRNHRWGVPLSLFVQGVQVPIFMSPGAA